MKTRVAFFADILIKDFDGASRTMFHILERIPRDRFEFLFITGKGPENEFAFEVKEVSNFKIPFNDTYSMALPILNYFSLVKKLDAFKPDIIHIASPSFLGNFALDYAESRSLPKVSIYHTHFISYVSYYLNHTPIITDLAEKAVISGQRKFYNRCDLVLVPTGAIRNELVGYGFQADKLILWQRGIDHSLFNQTKANNSLLKEITGNSDPVILFASRMVWEKNLQILVGLYQLFQREKRKINFLMVGDGVAKEELMKLMSSAVFTGKVDQEKLAVLYASSDVFVFPSISETYGNVVVEAMACGLPCIVGNGGGSASFIRQGINGFLCDPKDPNDFKEKIDIILNSPTLRSQIVEGGILYTASLKWESLVENYFSILESMTRKSYLHAG